MAKGDLTACEGGGPPLSLGEYRAAEEDEKTGE